MDAPTTKKFVGALSAKGCARARAPFLIPALDGSLSFIDFRSGKTRETGYVVYIGRAITADDVLEKVKVSVPDVPQARLLLSSFIAELQRFKIGNELEVEHSDGSSVRLRLIANSPESRVQNYYERLANDRSGPGPTS
jgi:hypothetical protein